MDQKRDQPRGCQENCSKPHTMVEFAEFQGVSVKTVQRWKKRGLPVNERGFIPCDQARRWLAARPIQIQVSRANLRALRALLDELLEDVNG